MSLDFNNLKFYLKLWYDYLYIMFQEKGWFERKCCTLCNKGNIYRLYEDNQKNNKWPNRKIGEMYAQLRHLDGWRFVIV